MGTSIRASALPMSNDRVPKGGYDAAVDDHAAGYCAWKIWPGPGRTRARRFEAERAGGKALSPRPASEPVSGAVQSNLGMHLSVPQSGAADGRLWRLRKGQKSARSRSRQLKKATPHPRSF